jgi:hypothetical protein
VNRSWLLAVLLSTTVPLCAQDQPAQTPPAKTPAAQNAPAEQAPAKEPAYVRRISLGVTGIGQPMNVIPGIKQEQTITTPPLDTTVTTSPKAHYAAGGALLQFAFYDRWAVNVGAIYRSAEFEANTIILAGVDNPNTAKDERTQTGITDKTKARYLDFPLLVRRYNLYHNERGHRWFLEAGPSLRWVSKIRTDRRIDYPNGTSATESSPTPYKKTITGFTAGIGGQFIDPVGVRVIPEVRYTRWLGATFDSLGIHSRRDQVDIVISISF